MIARLFGKLVFKGLDRVIIDVGGVGFDVMVSLNTLQALPEEDIDVLLHIHTHVREDALQLMGFASLEERDLFRMAIQISGIGPRMGLNLLSHITPTEFVDTIKRENLKRLTSIPGIGKRIAERIVVELRDKIKDLDLGLTATEASQSERSKQKLRDLYSALINFGYRPAQVEKAVSMLETEASAGTDLEQLVLMGLQKLNKMK
jgi:Holliday junction DNA helicase RuvA